MHANKQNHDLLRLLFSVSRAWNNLHSFLNFNFWKLRKQPAGRRSCWRVGSKDVRVWHERQKSCEPSLNLFHAIVRCKYCKSIHLWALYQNSTTRAHGGHHKLTNKLSLGLWGAGELKLTEHAQSDPQRVCSGLVQQTCSYFSLPSLHDYGVKWLNFTFYGESKHKTTILFFAFCTWIRLLRTQPEKNSRVFGKLNEMQ